MSDYVWVSSLLDDVDLIVLFLADIVEDNNEQAVEGVRAMKAGKPVPREQCPTVVWAKKGSAKVRDDQELPPLFIANGYPVVSSEAAGILRQFDLGGGALYPVRVLKTDRATPFAGDWFCWIFGNAKDTLNIAASENLREFSPIPDSDRRNLPAKSKDGDVALSREALSGPDVWLEKRLVRSVALSGPLGDALVAAGLKKAFRLSKARVI